MGNSFNKIEEMENFLLENIGIFVKQATNLPVFLLDKPFPSETIPSIGFRVIDYNDSNGWSTVSYDEDNYAESEITLQFTIEFLARCGRPMSNLALLLNAFRGFDELKYQALYSKGIGLLSCSNITEANTVFDGIETELRGRMLAVFNVCFKAKDLYTSEPIEEVRVRSVQNRYPNDPSPPVSDITILNPRAFLKTINKFYSFINISGLPKNKPSTWINKWAT